MNIKLNIQNIRCHDAPIAKIIIHSQEYARGLNNQYENVINI